MGRQTKTEVDVFHRERFEESEIGQLEENGISNKLLEKVYKIGQDTPSAIN